MKRISIWKIRKELFILYYAFHDRRTPVLAKLPAIGALIYLLSPIDIIPDFIPVVGYLDDLIIVPLLVNASIRLLPNDVYGPSQIKANQSNRKLNILFVLFFIFIIALIAFVVFDLTRRF